MSQITIKHIVSFLKQLKEADLSDVIANADLDDIQKIIVKISIDKTQHKDIPECIEFFRKLQSQRKKNINQRSLKKILQFLQKYPYTSPIVSCLEESKNQQAKPSKHI